MAFAAIPAGWLDVGDPTKKELFDRIKENFDDLDTRLSAVTATIVSESPIHFQVIGPYYNESFPLSDACGRIRIPFNITLTSARVHVVDAGTSGTLDVDVQRKTSAGGAFSTIFSTKPTVAFGAGNDAVSTNAIFSITDLDAGWFLKIDIVTPQTGNTRFNVWLDWEVR